MKKEKSTRRFEAESIGLPPLKVVLGEIPKPDPAESERPKRIRVTIIEKESVIKRLITHIKNNL